MITIVEKYGGTSVNSVDHIKRIASRIARTHSRGKRVVVVVSAMGRTTDQLESLASSVFPRANHREMGMLLSTGEVISSALLAMALQAMGKHAVSFTGAQCGIYTDNVFTNAKILDIRIDRILKHLNRNEIVVVAGYQGICGDDITVLGRGGSDATAVALACALKADVCHIFSDVKGVYTADPHFIPSASLLEGISYEEMIEMAGSGSQVMMSRAVEIARRHDMKIRLSSSFENYPGTLITKEAELEQVIITGISVNENIAKIDIIDEKNDPQFAANVLGEISVCQINIVIMNFHETRDGETILSIIVRPNDVAMIEEKLGYFQKKGKISSYRTDVNVAQVSLVGSGIAAHYGVAHQIFQILAKNNIPILMTSTSEIKIALIVAQSNVQKAANLLHQGFALDKLTRKIVRRNHG